MELKKTDQERLFSNRSIEYINGTSLEKGLIKIIDLKLRPEFQWQNGRLYFELEEKGTPAVRVSVVNCELDFDLWRTKRNPVITVLLPVGFRKMRDYHA